MAFEVFLSNLPLLILFRITSASWMSWSTCTRQTDCGRDNRRQRRPQGCPSLFTQGRKRGRTSKRRWSLPWKTCTLERRVRIPSGRQLPLGKPRFKGRIISDCGPWQLKVVAVSQSALTFTLWENEADYLITKRRGYMVMKDRHRDEQHLSLTIRVILVSCEIF